MVQQSWWERRWFLALLVLGSALPLLPPETPPLMDVPAHMGRYRIQLDLSESLDLQRYYEFHWALIGNLGVDLLVIPMAKLFGLEPAVKLIVLTIPPLTVAGLLWVAKEVHGKIPPTAMFAIPFVYGYPFNFGFINYALSLALALNAFALWLYLTRIDRIRLRSWLFVPIGFMVWVTHAFGWGVLGLLAYSAELVGERDRGNGWRRSAYKAAIAVLPLAIPLIPMIVWRNDATGGHTEGFFLLRRKAHALVAALRDRWLIWDSFGVAAALLLLGAAIFDGRLTLSRRLVFPTGVLATAFILMPRQVFGSAYADMRLAPVALMIALLAIRPRVESAKGDRTLAWLGLAFVVLRLGGNTLSFALADRNMQIWLKAIDHIPRGAPVLWLQGDHCNARWEVPRYMHAGSFVITRKHGFSNDQWQVAQLLRVRYSQAGYFTQDPSSFIVDEECIAATEKHAGRPLPYDGRLESAMQRVPWGAFDYVWMMKVPGLDPERPSKTAKLTLVWRGEDSFLYRVEHPPKRRAHQAP